MDPFAELDLVTQRKLVTDSDGVEPFLDDLLSDLKQLIQTLSLEGELPEDFVSEDHSSDASGVIVFSQGNIIGNNQSLYYYVEVVVSVECCGLEVHNVASVVFDKQEDLELLFGGSFGFLSEVEQSIDNIMVRRRGVDVSGHCA